MRHSVRFALAALIVLGSATVGLTIPPLINYQGILTDGSGAPITTTTIVAFRIWVMDIGGIELWMESQFVTPDGDGGFNVLLGSVNSIPDSALAGACAYLSVTIAPDPEMSPRTQLVAVAYAFRPGTVDGATGGIISGDVAIQSDLDVDGDLRITGKATIGTGHTNTGIEAFVAGFNSTASGDHATVGGGALDTASGEASTVAGGQINTASGDRATVGGGAGNTASAGEATVSGGLGNTASSFAAAVGGGELNSASAIHTTVGGGAGNTAGGIYATVGGGLAGTALGPGSTISGGSYNIASGDSSTVGGGARNLASGVGATVAGGIGDSASDYWSTVGGGFRNTASGNGATVGGGIVNTASGTDATVAGGYNNNASGIRSTISGGRYNRARGLYSLVAGGGGPDLPDSNSALGDHSTVGGGAANIASGRYATVPGGRYNAANGDYALAAGFNARAQHAGTIVLSANAGAQQYDSVWSSAGEQMILRADAGFYLTNAAGAASTPAGRFLNTSTGAYLTTGGTWTNTSDRDQKEDFTLVDREELLEKIAALPITRWKYKVDGPGVHHIGPIAQDFHALFGVGSDDKSISTIDPAGIALAAIQELDKRTQRIGDLAEQNQRLESELGELRSLVEELMAERR